MMPRCAFIKGDGERCRGVAIRASDYCAAHDPSTQERRRAGASRGGRARGTSEISEVKRQLARLAEDTLAGRVDRGVAVAVTQIRNTQLRALALERDLREQEEFEARLEALEQRYKVAG